ncbi:MAG: DNA-deoxyinosine glycosylase [Desulfitobacterium sp.]|nr:DNA-deoxyinosine glycosylase [Desulfitobacterium sp.]
MVKSFQPIITDYSKILILGSMPGEVSLAKHEYYGNPRNKFWRIFYSLMNMEYQVEYEKRYANLLECGWALWDVILSCERQGSLDINIKNAISNDFKELYRRFPGLKIIAFNGTKAYDIYRRQVGLDLKDDLVYHVLPSTSPANTMTFEMKLEKWRVLTQYRFSE